MKNERVDDIPLLPAQMERMGIVVDGSHTWRAEVGHPLPSACNYGSQGLWSQAQKEEQIIVVAGILLPMQVPEEI